MLLPLFSWCLLAPFGAKLSSYAKASEDKLVLRYAESQFTVAARVPVPAAGSLARAQKRQPVAEFPIG